jgi:plasmid stabilization system protein ParE
MKLVYSRRAGADLSEIAIYYAANASPAIAEAIERRLGMSLTAFAVRPKPPRAYRNALTSA